MIGLFVAEEGRFWDLVATCLPRWMQIKQMNADDISDGCHSSEVISLLSIFGIHGWNQNHDAILISGSLGSESLRFVSAICSSHGSLGPWSCP